VPSNRMKRLSFQGMIARKAEGAGKKVGTFDMAR